MLSASEPILFAADVEWSQLVWAGVVTVIFIGSWIANKIKGDQDPKAPTGSTGPVAGSESPEQDAARRRQELRRASGQGAPASPGGGAEPQDLTLAERIERARAAAQYRQRAEALREKTATSAGRQPPSQQQRQAARPPSQSSRQPVPARPQPRPPAQRPKPPAPAPARGRARPVARPQRAVVSREPDTKKLVHGTISDNRAVAAPVGSAPKGEKRRKPLGLEGALLGRSLRTAIVLKEVLDRPLALRGPQER